MKANELVFIKKGPFLLIDFNEDKITESDMKSAGEALLKLVSNHNFVYFDTPLIFKPGKLGTLWMLINSRETLSRDFLYEEIFLNTNVVVETYDGNDKIKILLSKWKSEL